MTQYDKKQLMEEIQVLRKQINDGVSLFIASAFMFFMAYYFERRY